MIEYLGLLLGLALLIGLALRGNNIVVASLLAALVVAATNQLNPLIALTRDYSTGPLGAHRALWIVVLACELPTFWFVARDRNLIFPIVTKFLPKTAARFRSE